MYMAFGMAVGLQNALKTPLAAKYYLQLAYYADSLKNFDRATEYYNNLGFTYFAGWKFRCCPEILFSITKIN